MNDHSPKDAEENFRQVLDTIGRAAAQADRKAEQITLVAVTKTFDSDAIRPVLDMGHRVFGENRVQEARGKWPQLRKEYDGLELHLIGPLQSNKAGDAVALFDVIESVDREKIARAIATEMKKQGRTPQLFVQVNTGGEEQKGGIAPQQAVAFAEWCRTDQGLTIEGLMCIPPLEENPGPHFALLAKLAGQCGIAKLSMGMSGDYETAIAFGATHVRVGSAIFGSR